MPTYLRSLWLNTRAWFAKRRKEIARAIDGKAPAISEGDRVSRAIRREQLQAEVEKRPRRGVLAWISGAPTLTETGSACVRIKLRANRSIPLFNLGVRVGTRDRALAHRQSVYVPARFVPRVAGAYVYVEALIPWTLDRPPRNRDFQLESVSFNVGGRSGPYVEDNYLAHAAERTRADVQRSAFGPTFQPTGPRESPEPMQRTPGGWSLHVGGPPPADL